MTLRTSLTVERVFDATPEELWDAWTDPEQYRKWYHPVPGMELVVHEFDLRAGGRIHVDMPLPGGNAHTTRGIFHAVEPHRRLVFGAEDGSELHEVTLAPAPGGTRMTVTWTSASPGMQAPGSRQRALMAWESSSGKLERLLAR
jgi:uncharacterized protein YndB with AHSA1/START domain